MSNFDKKSSDEKESLLIYTDGGCHGNPGPGAWACVIIDNGNTSEISGGNANTTNNRMELTAAIEALRTVTKNAKWNKRKIEFFCDSKYVKSGISEWIFSWKSKGWKTSAKKDVLNKDLWEELDELASRLSIEWKWVKGHAGIEYNERCDALCQKEMLRFV
ncbi:MAG: ribonuclease HI [Treponema sp.]|nr:ribonuclease HI [Treponema sp.]